MARCKPLMVLVILYMTILSTTVTSQAIEKVRAEDHEHAHKRTTTNPLGANQTLSSYLWESSIDLLEEVYKTTFIEGVLYGSMDPDFYGAYIMQDAEWCGEISKLWAVVAANASAAQELRAYATNSTRSYLSCKTALLEAFGVKFDGVIIGSAATHYANVVQSAIENYGSPYIMIATYACVKLWSNITANLSTMVNASNPYSVWVHNNVGNSSATRQAAFIDTWAYSWYNWNNSLSIFRQAMGGEIGLFNLQVWSMFTSLTS